MTALKLSKYLIARNSRKGDLMTNKKLQKLLYYVEAWSLVHMESMFEDDIEAWVHGPVIPTVYAEYKQYGYNAIPYEEFDIEKYSAEIGLNSDQIELIDEVLLQYGNMSSFALEMKTHSEAPWLIARKDYPAHVNCSEKIDRVLMKDYYSKRINGKG